MNKSRIVSTIALSACAVATGAPATIAHAQEAEAANKLTDDIVVTARRREERLQDVPLQVTALSSDSLTKAGMTSTIDLPIKTPGLTIGFQGGAIIPFIRGVGSANAASGQENAIPTYIDGVYLPSPFASVMALTNIERVEVLKGPQGTLFGRNATGGLINIVTRDPQQTLTADLRVGAGSFETITASAYISGGITSTLSSDIAFYQSYQGKGWGKNLFTGNDAYRSRQYVMRSKTLWEPSDRTRIRFSIDYSKSRDGGSSTYRIADGAKAVGGFLPPAKYHDIDLTVDPVVVTKSFGTSLNIKQSFDSFDIVSITAYRRYKGNIIFDYDVTSALVANADMDQSGKSFTQEVQFVSTWDSPLEIIAGAFYYRDSAGYPPHGIKLTGPAPGFPAPPLSISLNGLVKTNSLSAFVEASYKITSSTKLTIGGRYTRDKRKLIASTDIIDADDNVIAAFPSPILKAKFSDPSYRAILDHKLSNDIMLYASYSRGFKSGNFNVVAPGPAYKPETLDAYEIGMKGDLFNRLLRLNLSFFKYDYKNLQLSKQLAAAQVNINVPSTSRIKGVDFETILRLAPTLSLNAGGAYIDSKYGAFPDAPCNVPVAGGGNAAVATGCDATGNQLIRTPKLSFYVGIDYALETRIGSFDFNAVLRHSSSFPWKPDGRIRQKGYDLLNGGVTWSLANSPLSLAVIGKNLLDKEYALFGEESPFASFITPGAPRTVMVEGRYRF